MRNEVETKNEIIEKKNDDRGFIYRHPAIESNRPQRRHILRVRMSHRRCSRCARLKKRTRGVHWD